MANPPLLLLSCEHAGNHIPREYQPLFTNCRRLLAGHRGYDFGALACARALGRRLRARLFTATCSRLLVDLNRSPGHRALFSDRTCALSQAQKQRLLAHHYFPHRQKIEQWIGSRIKADNSVVHIAVHSFTPVLNGIARRADIGLLYDPARAPEAAFCRRWHAALKVAGGGKLAVRRNYPYRGTSDGLTRHLRTRFAVTRYIGVELEINQALLRQDDAYRSQLFDLLTATLRQTLRG